MGEVVARLEEVLGGGEAELGELSSSAGEATETASANIEASLSPEERAGFDSIRKDIAEIQTLDTSGIKPVPGENVPETSNSETVIQNEEKQVELNENEMSSCGANIAQVTTLKAKFSAKVKTVLHVAGRFLNSSLFPMLVKNIASNMKEDFIMEMLQDTIDGVRQIVKDMTAKQDSDDSSLTPEQVATQVKLKTFLLLVIALFNVIDSLSVTFENATYFLVVGAGSDPLSGANLALDMKLGAVVIILGCVSHAQQAATNMLLCLGASMNAMGCDKKVSSSAFVSSIIDNPTLLTSGVSALDVATLTAFRDSVNEMTTKVGSVLESTYLDAEKHLVMALFFKMPPIWNATALAISNFIAKVNS